MEADCSMKGESVLVITDGFRFIGGAETYIEKFSSIFKQHGNKVDCLTYFQDFEVGADSDIHMLSFKHGNFNLFGFNISRFVSFIKMLIFLSKRGQYTKIFLHLYISPFIFYGINLFRKADTHLVVHGIRYLEIESEIALSDKQSFFKKIKKLIKFYPQIIFYKKIQKFALQKCQSVIVLSPYTKSQVMSCFKIDEKKIKIIPGAIDQTIYKPVAVTTKELLREKLGFARDYKLIVLVSRIEPRKNVLSAIQAMSLVAKKFKKSILLIISPSQDAYSQSYLADCYTKVANDNLGNHIVFTTGINNAMVANYYQVADLTLMVSNDLETFGYTMMESLACGTPVIGTGVGNIELVLSKISKNLIAQSDYKDIALRIIQFLSLPKREKDLLSRKCLEEVNTKYNYQSFMYNYQGLVDGKR